MPDDRTLQLRLTGFRKAEASLRLEGMDPSGMPLYESVKARLLSGDITLTKAVLRYRSITRSGRTVTDVDRKCFVITAASLPATKQWDKMCFWSTAGTPNPPGQAPPDTLLLFVKSDPFAVFLPRLTAWPTSHGHTVNCAPVHRF